MSFLRFGGVFDEVPIFMENVTFERNLLIVKGLKMTPTIHIELNHLWKPL
jgi:hypothetical protein